MNVTSNIIPEAKTAGEATFDQFGRLENGGELPVIPSSEYTYNFTGFHADEDSVYDRVSDAVIAQVAARSKD